MWAPPWASSHTRCGKCGKSYADRSYLRIHAMIHAGKRPHACPMCGRGFVHPKFLRSHRKSHEGKKGAMEASRVSHV
ncbi:unnamed protein product [Lampetra fluviatilis]